LWKTLLSNYKTLTFKLSQDKIHLILNLHYSCVTVILQILQLYYHCLNCVTNYTQLHFVTLDYSSSVIAETVAITHFLDPISYYYTSLPKKEFIKPNRVVKDMRMGFKCNKCNICRKNHLNPFLLLGYRLLHFICTSVTINVIKNFLLLKGKSLLGVDFYWKV